MEIRDKSLYVQRYLANELSDEEAKYFNNWLNIDSENKLIYDQLNEIWLQPVPTINVTFNKEAAYLKHLAALKLETLETEEFNSTQSVDRSIDNQNLESRNQNSTTRIIKIRWMQAVAAVFVLAMGAVFLLNTEKIEKSFIANDQAQAVALNDGTNININQGSILNVYTFDKIRKVALKGEAFFDVKRDVEKPFVIKTDNAEIKVLGTKFTVSSIESTVNVKEGKVEVTVDGTSVSIGANQSVNFKGGMLHTVENIVFDDSKLWFNDQLIFNNAPFDKVIDDLSRVFKVTFNLPKNRDWSNCTFTSGSLKNSTLDEVLILLQLTYQLDYEKLTQDSYKLTKVKCK